MKSLVLILGAVSLAIGMARPAGAAGPPPRPALESPDATAEARQLLDQGTRDKNPDLRKEVVIAFSLLGENDELLKTFRTLIDDKDVLVRLAVVSVLGDLKNRQTIPLLKHALDDPVPEVEFAAAKVLYQLRDPAGKQALLAAKRVSFSDPQAGGSSGTYFAEVLQELGIADAVNSKAVLGKRGEVRGGAVER